MPIAGTINGREINALTINAGIAGSSIDIDVNMSMAIDQETVMGNVQEIATAGDIVFDQGVDVELTYPMHIEHGISFGQLCGLSVSFFGHWLEGTRVEVATDRGLRVPEDYRMMSVAPEPVRTVRQMTVRVPPDNRRMRVPREIGEVVPQKDLEVAA
jgi:hypothetical protein